jgi:hypothetical protein
LHIVLHLGAHRTDEDALSRALLPEASALAQDGVVVPPASHARPALRNALRARRESAPDAAVDLAEQIAGADAARCILSFEGFLGTYRSILGPDGFYPDAGAQAATLRGLFPEEPVSMMLAIRNPASFVPACFEASAEETVEEYLRGVDPEALLWGGVVERIRATCPDVPLTIWCNEDLPLLWPNVLKAATGLDRAHAGDHDILKRIMSEPGFARFEAYLEAQAISDRATWRKVVTAFLARYADPERIDREITLPLWTQDVITALTAQYEDDVAAIGSRDDITFLAP